MLNWERACEQGRLIKILIGFNMDDSKSRAESQEEGFKESKVRAEELENAFRSKNKGYAPLPLQRVQTPPKPFPFGALGVVPGAAAKRIHEVVQAPDGTCGQSILAVMSLACQGFIDVEVDGRVYPTSLFFITISESGERKSGADRVALKSIYEWQKMLVQQHKKEQVDFKNKHDLWKKKREAALKEATESSKKTCVLTIEDEPKSPCEGLMICDEPTLEGLEQLLGKGQPSGGIFSDEGGRLIGGHAMNADNALKTACGLSNLWDGKPLTRVRKSEGSKIYYGRRLAMHLMIQPVVLTELMGNSMLMGQGVLARCLFAAPVSIAGTRKYKEVDLSIDPDVLAFQQRINDILNQPYPSQNKGSNDAGVFDSDDALTPIPMTLDLEAKKLWKAFHDETDAKMAEGQIYSTIKPFASKAAEQVLRIAAIFAFFEQLSSDTRNILLEHLNRAIVLIEFYLSEALRILGSSVTDPDLALAAQTLKWLRKERAGAIFPLSDVYQNGPAQIRNADKARSVMKLLQQHEYVNELKDILINRRNVRSAWQLIECKQGGDC